MTDRVKRLYQRMNTEQWKIGIEKYKIIMETEREMGKRPAILVRAQTFANTCDRMPITIPEDELLLGNPSSQPFGLEIEAALGLWDKEECELLRRDGYLFSEADEEEMLRMNEQYRPFGMNEGANLAVSADERLDPFVQTGIVLAPWKDRSFTNRVGGGTAASGLGLGPGWMLICIDWNLPLRKGFNAMIEECNEELRNNRFFNSMSLERSCSLQAMRTCLQAAIRYANRVADAAWEAAKTAKTEERRRELMELSEICRRVPAEPARTFREAMQCVWLIFMMIGPSQTASFGRFDQYMYPFYKADKEAGRITDEEVVEYLDCLRMRCMEIQQVHGASTRKKHSGNARWYNMTIGGVKEDGSDATNELSYLILDAVMDCRTTHHTVTVRVAESTPQALILKGIECYRQGCAMPAFASDKSYIDYFTQRTTGEPGMSLEHARDFCMCGCIDGNVPGRTRNMAVCMFVLPLTLDIFMNHGVCKNTGVAAGHDAGDLDQFATFEDFLAAYEKELNYFIGLAAEKSNIENLAFRDLTPNPFKSALLTDGIKVGLDMNRREYEFENNTLINAVGMMNLAQSLFAIRQIVFEEKRVTLSQLKEILDNNWEGHEELRQYCLSLPHYGNDEDDIDNMVSYMYRRFNEMVNALPASYYGHCRCNAISVTSHQPGGALTGATADGRLKGETLADANASPIRGMDTNGPLAVFNSAMKIDQSNFQAFLMNMKFHPSALQTEADQNKLADAVRTYLTHGGKMIQFNVVDAETLNQAHMNPAEHKDLIVRVAGYSAYFVQLSDGIQEEVIERTAHSF